MAFEIAIAISLIGIVSVMAYFFSVLNSDDDKKNHNFLRIIFFVLCFPALTGLAYYAKVVAVVNGSSAGQVSVLLTFYKFTMYILIVVYAYLLIRTFLWMLSKFKQPKDMDRWEREDQII